MRSLTEIRDETIKELLNYNCPWEIICLVAMTKAIKEFIEDVIGDIENNIKEGFSENQAIENLSKKIL